MKEGLVGYLYDYETRSRCNLLTTTNEVYAKHPSTEVLCVAYAPVYWDGKAFDVDIFSIKKWNFQADFDQQEIRIADDMMMFALNAPFEYHMTNSVMVPKYGMKPVKIEQMYCLQALSLSNGLPKSLDDISKAMPLKTPKSKEGHAIMMKMCKPDKKTDEFPFSQELLQGLTDYCDVDIVAEAEILTRCRPLSEDELSHFHVHMRINERGIPLDRELLTSASTIVAEAVADIAKKVSINLRSHVAIKKFALEHGFVMESTDKEHVLKYLSDPTLPDALRPLLQAKELGIGSSSVSKFDSMQQYVSADGFMRLNYTYHGAIRSGRFTAGGPQVHNLPRGEKYIAENLPMLRDVRNMIKTGDMDGLHMVTNGRVMDAMRSVVRSTLACPEGYTFVQRDLSAIEARGVLWVAGAESLELFFDFDKGAGPEPYMIFAEMMDPNNPNRFLGKQSVLSSGYGCGPYTFAKQCTSQGVPTDEATAKLCIDTYKRVSPEVKVFWDAVEAAAVQATAFPGKITEVVNNGIKVSFYHNGTSLLLKLPSERVLTYYGARIAIGKFDNPVVSYMTHGSENGKAMGWHRTETWGGTITGHIVQGFSACILKHILREMEKAGLPVTSHTHDEAVHMCKIEDAQAVYDKMGLILKTPPPWAKGLPIQSKGWINNFYIKD